MFKGNWNPIFEAFCFENKIMNSECMLCALFLVSGCLIWNIWFVLILFEIKSKH